MSEAFVMAWLGETGRVRRTERAPESARRTVVLPNTADSDRCGLPLNAYQIGTLARVTGTIWG